MMHAPICTEGPSLPAENPAASALVPNKTFPNASLMEMSGVIGGSVLFKAALVWGIPLPLAPGNHFLVIQTTIMPANGVRMSGSHQFDFCMLKNNVLACSVIRANITTINPAVAAASHTMSLPFHASKSVSLAERMAKRISRMDNIWCLAYIKQWNLSIVLLQIYLYNSILKK